MFLATVAQADTSLRITVPRQICHALKLQKGDRIVLVHVAPNQVVMQNLSEIVKTAPLVAA